MNKLCLRREIEKNILVVGKTGCGKTTFAQKLALSNLFVDLEKVECVSKIDLSKFQEADTQSCFSAPVEY